MAAPTPPPTPASKVKPIFPSLDHLPPLHLNVPLKPIDTNICRICLKTLGVHAIKIVMSDITYAYCSLDCHRKHSKRQQQKVADLFAKMALKKSANKYNTSKKTTIVNPASKDNG